MNRADINTVKQWVIAHTTDVPVKESGFFLKERYFSADQVRQHNRMDDAWVVDAEHKIVYNITPIFNHVLLGHPGLDNDGMRTQLMRRLGGAQDISFDLKMHRGDRAQALWQAMRIGKIIES